jgi:peptidoglycan/LPS O-acetylase OafA/YrhL
VLWNRREVIARLTYGAYILHPMIFSVIYFSMTQLQRYSVLQLTFNAVAGWGLSYGLAIGLFLLVEKPFMNLEVLLFKKLGVSA